jgi:DMATS type aromatic prenyltransferase
MTRGSSQKTSYEYGAEQLSRLCEAVGFTRPADALKLFREMLGVWGGSSLESTPTWHSDVTDDTTPFEFSIAFREGSSELRFLIEAQGTSPTLSSYWEAGLALSALLARRYGVDLERLHRIESLFSPTGSSAAFAIWHAVCLRPDRPPDFKLYLSPQAKGKAQARAVVEEALQVLGLASAWEVYAEHALRRGPELDALTFFSIDLTPRPEARVKVYTAHHAATLDDLMAVLRAAPDDPAELARFYQVTTSGRPHIGRPPITSLAFTAGRRAPIEATLHVPIRAYVAHDEEARDRIRAALATRAHALSVYDRVIAAFAARRLDAGVGMHSYVSRCTYQGGSRHTIYISPEAYRVMPPRMN